MQRTKQMNRTSTLLFSAYIILMLLLAVVQGRAADKDKPQDIYVVSKPKGEATKLEALKALMNAKPVYRCQEVTLSDKLTIVKKK